SGNVHIFLSTVIGYISEPDNEIEGESPWLWTGDRRNFTGYQFFTNPDGSFRSAFQYKDSHRTSIILSLYDKNEEYVFPQSFFSISLGSLGTKGEGIQEYKKYCWDCQREFDWTESYCPQCGTMLEMLDEITIIPQPDHICDKCNFLIENCVCEDHDYGDEDQCPYCLGHDCSGECRNTGGDGTGSGGGTTPGGNQGEGGENNDEQTSLIDKFKEKADEKSKNEIIPLLIEMERKNDCMTNQLLSSLQDVEIQYDANLATAICSTYVNYTTQVEKRIIRWGMNIAGAEETASLILLEELIHAMQFQMQWINDSNKINAEVEAKVAVYKYAVHHNILNKLTGYGYWQDAIEPYLANPTQETYSDVVDFVRWLEPNVYGDEVEFKYDSRIVDLQVIGTFFCY
ncbi:MAG: zinc ribbon domain-containing protein, partial [Bacteroidales bacterium]|nr:zinc ribbon domain-containing protein [Bacteroidales bacterium]